MLGSVFFIFAIFLTNLRTCNDAGAPEGRRADAQARKRRARRHAGAQEGVRVGAQARREAGAQARSSAGAQVSRKARATFISTGFRWKLFKPCIIKIIILKAAYFTQSIK